VAQIVLLDNKFATLPAVVGEGRRVIGNIERVSTLFLAKTVYSVLLALLVGVPGLVGFQALPYPFLPRHVTIVGWFTIGLPAFVLSLAPNNDRARGGFVGRVLRLAMPAGIATGLAGFVCYAGSRHGHTTDHREQVQVSTTALITLIALALWVLGIVMRPFVMWKLGLLVLMVALSALMFATHLTRRIFELDPSSAGDTVLAFGCAAAGIAVIEAAWWITGRVRGQPRALWARQGPAEP
jgi:cation-transporting ATPase E